MQRISAHRKMGLRARSSIAAHLSSPLMRSVFLGVLPILLTAGLCGSTPTPPPASPPPWWLVGNGSESTDQYMLVTSLSCAASGCVELSSERCRAASSWVHTVLDPEEMYYYWGETKRLASPPACYVRNHATKPSAVYGGLMGGTVMYLLQWTSERFELHSRPEMRVLLPKRRGRIASFAPERPAMECLVAASTVRVHARRNFPTA